MIQHNPLATYGTPPSFRLMWSSWIEAVCQPKLATISGYWAEKYTDHPRKMEKTLKRKFKTKAVPTSGLGWFQKKILLVFIQLDAKEFHSLLCSLS